jgi:AraC-like DNA-binding protein
VGSPEAFFVLAQHSQRAVGVLAFSADPVARLRAAWDVFDHIPRPADPFSSLDLVRILARLSIEIATLNVVNLAAHCPRSSAECRASEACRWLLRCHTDPRLSLVRLANAVGLSPCQACRILTRVTGYSYSAHLKSLRIVSAIRHLGDLKLSIKQVAAQAGFSSTAELDRTFRHALGITPTQFRCHLVGLDLIHSRGSAFRNTCQQSATIANCPH